MRTAFCLFILLALSTSTCQGHDHGWRWWCRHGKKLIFGGEEPAEPVRDCKSVAEIAVEAELEILVAALTAADLVNAVGPEFKGTVFAPTDEAFVKLLADLGLTAEELLANTELLTQVLLIHAVPDVVAFAADLVDGQKIPTAAEGVSVTVSLVDGEVFIVAPSGVKAKVVTADVKACDAVVHVIDAVLTPAPPAAEEETIVVEEEKEETIVVEEEKPVEVPEEPVRDCQSVAEIAVQAELNTLVAALTAADLANAVGPEFVGTVFAPTEEAFFALLADLGLTAEELLANTELLTQVLLIHVIPDVVAFAADLSDGQQIPTAVEGVFVTVALVDGEVFIVAPSGVVARVVTPDVEACDAVVHVIDAVLTPAPAQEVEEERTATATASATASSTDGEAASSTASARSTGEVATTEVTLASVEDCTSVAETAVNAELDTLVAALTAADLADVVGPEFVGTVFAPNEEAFAALLADLGLTAEELLADTDLLTQVLLIHVIPDVVAFSTDLEDGQEIPTSAEGVFVTVALEEDAVFIIAPSGVRAQVVNADIEACDAVVHVIDAVLTPGAAAAEPPTTEPVLEDDLGEVCTPVVETATNAELTTLIAALTAADLADVVGPEFVGTVFAPTEEAFASLLVDLELTAEELLADTDLLTQVLLIHVIPDVAALSTDLSDGQEIPTAAEGVVVTVSIEDESIFIVAPSGVRAQVVTPDIEACDAIVHLIDAVLTPA